MPCSANLLLHKVPSARTTQSFTDTFSAFASFLPRLAHQNRTIAIASDFRVDGAKSPQIPQKEGVLGSEIAARNRKSLATFHRTLKSQCSIAFSCLGNRAISGVRDGHRNRKSQKSLRFRCAKLPRLASGSNYLVPRWPRVILANKLCVLFPTCLLILGGHHTSRSFHLLPCQYNPTRHKKQGSSKMKGRVVCGCATTITSWEHR